MLQNLKNKLKDNKGFSLVELIVVIAIMVILIALLVPQVSGYIKKANDAANKTAAKAIYDAGVTYMADAAAANYGNAVPTTGTHTYTVTTDVVGFGTDSAKKISDVYVQNMKNGSVGKFTVDSNGNVTTASYFPNGGASPEIKYPDDTTTS